eukprot:15097943-Alexandrium_andersonii.AAC.1
MVHHAEDHRAKLRRGPVGGHRKGCRGRRWHCYGRHGPRLLRRSPRFRRQGRSDRNLPPHWHWAGAPLG